mgnify:CR=1 FL=1
MVEEYMEMCDDREAQVRGKMVVDSVFCAVLCQEKEVRRDGLVTGVHACALPIYVLDAGVLVEFHVLRAGFLGQCHVLRAGVLGECHVLRAGVLGAGEVLGAGVFRARRVSRHEV